MKSQDPYQLTLHIHGIPMTLWPFWIPFFIYVCNYFDIVFACMLIESGIAPVLMFCDDDFHTSVALCSLMILAVQTIVEFLNFNLKMTMFSRSPITSSR